MVTLISQEGGIVVFQGGGQVLTIDTNTCIMCTLCESVCPQAAMYFEDGYVGDGIYESLVYVGMRFKANDCDLTGACVSVCPPGCLTITNALPGPPDTFGPGEGPLPIQEITNNLTHPCLISAFAQINNSSSLNTDIGWMLHSVFNDWDMAMITISESTTMDNNLSGSTRPFMYGDIFKAEVSLNVNTLPNASMEYISGTIYHEIVHAYLQHMGIFGNLNNHNVMTLDYIEALKSTLQHYYPALSSADAEAIAWEGLDKTNAWAALSSTKRDQLLSLIISHRTGTRGTKCNP